jgi:hypothetical protein
MSSLSDSATNIPWTHSDEYRHQCLVRWLISMRIADRARAMQWLQEWQRRHPGSTLERDVRQQWALGNRGAKGDWRVDPGR